MSEPAAPPATAAAGAVPAPAGSALSWPGLLGALLRGQQLSERETAWAMAEIMAGQASAAQLAGFAVLLRAKGETASEMTGLVRSMLANAGKVEVPGRAVDIVGTGGDRSHTVNLSTMAAVVVAGSGAPVVKHGNRAASSSCGAADLLEYLGVAIDLAGPGVARCVAEAGIGFCFAPVFHPGMRHAGAVRRELGVPTAFNFLGPLTNPAQPPAAAIGCADERMAPVMAEVIAARGGTALVFRGADGLDELTTTSTTAVWVVRDGVVTPTVVDATALGLPAATPESLRGADAAFNAGVAHSVFAGERGPVRDAVLLNAAAGIAAYDGLAGTVHDALAAGLAKAADAVDSGAAAAVLERWIATSTAARAAATQP
jgi:anthranilate phosphoribosyltransferase